MSWASRAAQAKQEAIVVAGLYGTQPVTSSFGTTNAMPATINLVKQPSSQYSVDTKRLYSTGQSGGAMLAIAMNIAHPELFAASWVVVGQWDPKVAPMGEEEVVVTVAEGDAEAYPIENEMIPVLQQGSATVSRATWDGKACVATLDADARKQAAKGGLAQLLGLHQGYRRARGGRRQQPERAPVHLAGGLHHRRHPRLGLRPARLSRRARPGCSPAGGMSRRIAVRGDDLGRGGHPRLRRRRRRRALVAGVANLTSGSIGQAVVQLRAPVEQRGRVLHRLEPDVDNAFEEGPARSRGS